MAENDIELSVGIKFDDAQFTNEYQSKLNKLSKATQTQIQGAMDEMSGPAAKQWGTLPFAGMHDPNSGNTIATQAFLSSLSRDLQGAGYSGTAYESALINATYRSSMADPMQRYHRMLAMGLTQQADLTHPDTALGKTIETDYALMSQPWSRDFIKTTNYKGQKRSYVDFAGMREYAVEAGLGRWIDEGENAGKNTADNFELINDELEKIDEKSVTSKKTFSDWNDTLKGVLGTLTAIGSIVGITKAFEVAYKASEAGVTTAATTLDRRRGLIGMTATEELQAKVASKGIGLGEDAIKNEIYNLSNTRERFKTFGQGDVLPQALLGVFKALTSTDTPYDAYVESADKLYESFKNMDTTERSRALMLMDSAGLGNMANLVGAFISNPKLAEKYGTPSKLFDLRNNPFRSTYEDAETMLPEIVKLNDSLKASYSEMYRIWEQDFGIPFKDWWDTVMQDQVVPWFQKLSSYLHRTEAQREADAAGAEFGMIILGGAFTERNKAIEKQSGKFTPAYSPATGGLGIKSWTGWLGGDMQSTGEGATATWNFFNRVANTKTAEIYDIDSDENWRNATIGVRDRVKYMVKRLKDTQLSDFLTNSKREAMDKYLLQVMQMGAYDTSEDWREKFDGYIDKVLGGGGTIKSDTQVIDLLSTIASNTAAAGALRDDPDFWYMVELYRGKGQSEKWKTQLETSINRGN